MTFKEWWENESGWGGELLAEGQLAKDAWNMAMSQAGAECLKSEKRPHSDKPDGVGARNCIEISAAINELYAR
jgi:hypothetical protein